MNYLQFAYPTGNGSGPAPGGQSVKNDPDAVSYNEKTLGVHYHTWRNVIGKECLAEKTDFDSRNNPEAIPPYNPHKKRYQDQNFIQVAQPLQVFRPTTLAGGHKKNKGADKVPDGLKGIVRSAATKNLKVKAVGSGHSFSDVATTSDFLVATDDLDQILRREGYPKKTLGPDIRHYPWLKQTVRDGYAVFLDDMERTESGAKNSSRKFYGEKKERPNLVEFEAGIKIAELNDKLWNLGWSLYNMGTYQGQSFIGAASTSTHGSGHTLPPLPDMIKSMVLVADKGIAFRIEPTCGISHTGTAATEDDFKAWFKKDIPDGYKQLIKDKHLSGGREEGVDFLIQDDDWFAAALVNVGTFGIVYSVIIEVIPRYYLLETVEYSTWENVKKRLLEQNGFLLDAGKNPGRSELLEEKKFVAKFPAKKNLTCEENENEQLHTVWEIRQTTIEIHPHKIEGGSEKKGDNMCRIMRQYKVEEGAFAQRWSKKNEGRLSGFFAQIFGIDTAKAELNKAWENVAHNPEDQKKWYVDNTELTAVALLRPVSGDLLEALGVLMNKKKKIMDVLKNVPVEPTCREHYLNRNYRTQFIPLFPGYGVELGFTTRPLKEFNNTPGYIAAMDRILELADQHWELGRYMQSSPLALRMVKASNAYLSMQHGEEGEPTCMIELLNQLDTHGGKELLSRYQRELFKYGARPHWGLDLSVTTGNNQLLENMYPKFVEWFNVYKTLNACGTFNNRFTDRMGLS